MMVFVETSLKTIQDEVNRLVRIETPEAALYVRGALDTLSWLVSGEKPPSAGGMTQVELGEENVH